MVRALVKVSSSMGFCPYKYYPAKRHFRIHYPSWSRSFILWIFALCYVLIILPTNFCQLYKAKDFQQINYVVIYFLSTTCSNIFVGMQVVKPKQFCQGLNAVWRFLETLPEMYIPEHDVRKDKRKMQFFHLLVSVAATAVVAFTIILILHYYFFPTSGPFLTFSIPPHYMFSWIWLGNCIYMAYSVTGMLSNVALFLLYAIAYFQFIMPIFRNELKMGQRQYKTKAEFRTPLNLLVNWRSVEIFVVNVTDNEFGFIFVPLQMTISFLTLFSNVTLVYHSHSMQTNSVLMLISNLVLCTTGWAIFLYQAGKQFHLSAKVLNTWRPDVWKPSERKYMMKVKRACRPIWVGDGKRYVIRPVSVLNFFRSLSKNSCRALITYGKLYGHSHA